MGDRPQCPPVKAPQAPDPECCKAIPGEKPCCTPVEKEAEGPVPAPEVLLKLKRDYEKLTSSGSKSLLRKYLSRGVYDKLKLKMTSQGSTLLDIVQSGFENHDSKIGVYAADPECYSVFAPLFDPIIADYHGFGPTDVHPPHNWGDPRQLSDLDPEQKYIRSTRVRCCRSIEGYPFNPQMTLELYLKMEKEVASGLSQLDGVHAGKYVSLVDMNPRYKEQLIEDHFLFKEGDKFMADAKACEFWPQGRGIFMNEDMTFLVWVGEEDHLRIISMQMGGDLGEVYERLVQGAQKIEKLIHVVRHPRLGYLTFCPTNLGTTVRASVMISLPSIAKNKEQLERIAQKYNLQVRGSAGEHTVSDDGLYDVSNKRRLGLTEFEAVYEMYNGLQELIRLEQLKEESND